MPIAYSAPQIAQILHLSFSPPAAFALPDIEHLGIDSRYLPFPAQTLFFALEGAHRDGHAFVPLAYEKGTRLFVVHKILPFFEQMSDAYFFKTENTLTALQQMAAYHRRRFDIPVLGITGSNGKTIVKEWLHQLLQDDMAILRSPRSYNSQIGVPLSVWLLDAYHQMAIFEAGISQNGEMEQLRRIIQPTMGLLTNIGTAHEEGFEGAVQKLKEKLRLFEGCKWVIYNNDDAMAENYISTQLPAVSAVSWGSNARAQYQTSIHTHTLHDTSEIHISYGRQQWSFSVQFSDAASLQNVLHCMVLLLHQGYAADTIRQRLPRLRSLAMRLELKNAIRSCRLINDSYSADSFSLGIALDFLKRQLPQQHTLILSDFSETRPEIYQHLATQIRAYPIHRFVGVGEQLCKHAPLFDFVPHCHFFSDTEQLLQAIPQLPFYEECILLKGARSFAFERVDALLSAQSHSARLEVNLQALAHNYHVYRRLLKPSTKIMAMVKAFSYGAGGAEVAAALQYQHADYLAVAYADEGEQLRQAGIRLPVMVMNPDSASFHTLIQHQLEPELYSLKILREFAAFLSQRGIGTWKVHLELDSGMSRLGFAADEIAELCKLLQEFPHLQVVSVFSHLAASESADLDDFTTQQIARFKLMAATIQAVLPYKVLRHILNSAGMVRHAAAQMEMVRLGLGLHGIDGSDHIQAQLQAVSSLKVRLTQLHHLRKGQSVGYNASDIVQRDSLIATVNIGYADGLFRNAGNGAAKMMVRGQLVPTIGRVCMDMTMLDVSDVADVREDDEVLIFGEQLPVQQLAAACGTIPYEILTHISPRVRRVYFQE